MRRLLSLGRKERGVIALAIGIVLLGAAAVRVVFGSGSGTVPPPSSSPPSAGAILVVGKTLPATVAVLAGGLLDPKEAVQLRNSLIAVVDTGHKRLLFVDSSGHVVRTVRAGREPLREPFALAVSARAVYLLDSQARAIEQFALDGRFQREVYRSPLLDRPRALALAHNGDLIVANTPANTIVTISPNGKLVRSLSAPVGLHSKPFEQPSDVAVGADGTIYVLDNGNNLVRALRPDGRGVRDWRAPPSTTVDSAHVLPLPNGKILVSDPAGSLLLYRRDEEIPTRFQLSAPPGASRPVSPVGIARMSNGRILVTDASGGRLLVTYVRG